MSFNFALDHSWVTSGPFLEEAERRGVPVVQWILDHPSARWAEFYASTATNSRFLLNSEQQQRYFETYCLPGALTEMTGGVGPNRRTRIGELTRRGFMQRPLTCMIPLGLHRVRSVEEGEAAMTALAPAALAAYHQCVAPQTFDTLCQVVEESVQIFRRLKIFAVAQNYPVLIQSDESAARYMNGAIASLATSVGMQSTLTRIPTCRAVLSATPMNDMIHDRTMNALNAGCVAIAEASAAARAIFTHKKNALLFRYDDDSLEECLDIVCNRPEQAYEIARAGMALRDDPRIRFGQFHNIIDLAHHGRAGWNRDSRLAPAKYR